MPTSEPPDIEQNISGQVSSPTTASSNSSDSSSPDNPVNGDQIPELDEVLDVNAAATSKITKLVGCGSLAVSMIYNIISRILFLAIYYPFALIIHVISFSLTGKLQHFCMCHHRKWSWSSHRRNTKGRMYDEINDFETTIYKIKRIMIVTMSRLGCVLLVWLVINLCIPKLRRVTLCGSLLWKWSLFANVVLLGYPCTYVTMNLLRTNFIDQLITPESDGFYYVHFLQPSVRGFVYLSWVLLVWLLYFRTSQGLDLLNSQNIHKYITCTLVSFQVGAILWGFKRAVWLHWRANAIFNRFKHRILLAGFQLFFLSVIVDRVPLSNFPRSWVKKYKLSRNMSVYQLSWIASLVAHLAALESRDTNDVSEIITKYQHKTRANSNLRSEEYVTEEAIRNWLDDDEAELFLEHLQFMYPSKQINQIPFLKWMVDAHKNCVFFGCTLLDAFAAVGVLDTILTACIALIMIIVWLLITELATIKVFIVIASPFFAFTFIFGDTCKTFFQGVIFSFITHPFDVGDRCIIDGVEVEVKRISILTTTCFRIGTKEKMLYPNSHLATKVIINLDSKPDPTDVIELSLDSSTRKSQILRLRRCIRSFIGDENQRNLYERSCQVMVKELQNNVKIGIHFKHTMNVQDASHTRFTEMKNKRRSKLLIKIKQFAEDLNIKLAQTQ